MTKQAMSQQEWVDHIPKESHRRNYEKAVGIGQKASKAAAVKAKCLDCSCWDYIMVRDCTAQHCPLWPHRPYAAKNKGKEVEVPVTATCET